MMTTPRSEGKQGEAARLYMFGAFIVWSMLLTGRTFAYSPKNNAETTEEEYGFSAIGREPGVCRETREVEVIHNVTVYQPCIRRLAVPCGGRSAADPPRTCTLYAQRTCTYTTSRLQLQNVTGDVCCEGWTEGEFGKCIADQVIQVTLSNNTVTTVTPAVELGTNDTGQANSTTQPAPSITTPPVGRPSVLTSPNPNFTVLPTKIPAVDNATILSYNKGNLTVDNNTSVDSPPFMPPDDGKETHSKLFPENNDTYIGQADEGAPTPHNVTVPTVPTMPIPTMPHRTTLPQNVTTISNNSFIDPVNGFEIPPSRDEQEESKNTTFVGETTTTIALIKSTTTRRVFFLSSTVSQEANNTTTNILPTVPKGAPTTINISVNNSIVSPEPSPENQQEPVTNPPSGVTTTIYNILRLPPETPPLSDPKDLTKGDDGGGGSSTNGSVVLLAGTGRLPVLPPVVYVAVSIAAVVIVVTLVCALYVFVLRDKPRPGTNTLHHNQLGGLESGDHFLLTESVYASTCNGSTTQSVISSRPNGSVALPMPDADTLAAFRQGLPAILPDDMASGRLRMVPEEPPLITSTPMMGTDKTHGFGYNNPAYSGGPNQDGDQGSLSDTSNTTENPVTHRENNKDSDGYLVPVSRRSTPPPTPMTSECRSPQVNSHSLAISDYTEGQIPNTLNRTGSNSTHTYEEIPACLSEVARLNSESKEPCITSGSKESKIDTISENFTNGDETSTDGDVDVKSTISKSDEDNVSVDLVTFMTNYMSNTSLTTSVEENPTPTAATNGMSKNYRSPLLPSNDPNATYDHADMYTPATPSSEEEQTEIKMSASPQTHINRKDNMTYSEKPSVPYAATTKVKMRDAKSGALSWRDSGRRSSSYESIYDTVGPPGSKGTNHISKEESETAPKIPPLPARSRQLKFLLLDSPKLPIKNDFDYDVIDLSDNEETSSTAKCVHDNNNKLGLHHSKVNGTSSDAPSCGQEPHYLSLVGDDIELAVNGCNENFVGQAAVTNGAHANYSETEA